MVAARSGDGNAKRVVRVWWQQTNNLSLAFNINVISSSSSLPSHISVIITIINNNIIVFQYTTNI